MSEYNAAGADRFLEDDDDLSMDQKYLLCSIGKETFGISISNVTDIIELQKITEVPDLPDYVMGVINLRGQVIPVIDMRLRFRMEQREYDDRTVITVVNIRGRAIGFIVDTATEVVDISESVMSEPPRFRESGLDQRYIRTLGRIDEQVVIILDVEALVDEDTADALASAAG
jgi:purine-binding chemotaxis protein CheW